MKKTTPRKRNEINPELNAAVQELDNKKADEITVLDLGDKSSVARYFIIATATSAPHLNALSGALEKLWLEKFKRRLNTDSKKDSGWHVVDAGETLIHLFTQAERTRYNLEGLWGDAKQLKLKAVA